MTAPLVLQIQQALLDNSCALSEALRKAKVVCFKLGLSEFEAWVDNEIAGYMDKKFEEVPEYRKLFGTPEAFSPYQGWQPIVFASPRQKRRLSLAVIGMSIEAMERSLRDTTSAGVFSFPYPAEIENSLRKALSWGTVQLRIKLTVAQCGTILETVRSILLRWTLEMEKQGILGTDLMFNDEDRKKSAALTESIVNHIHIGQVGAFVQNATHSMIQGDVNAAKELAQGVHDLVRQVEQLLPASNLRPDIEEGARAALQELKEAERSERPDCGRLRNGMESLRRILVDKV